MWRASSVKVESHSPPETGTGSLLMKPNKKTLSLRELGASLGISHVAARKLVLRGMPRLALYWFLRRHSD